MKKFTEFMEAEGAGGPNAVSPTAVGKQFLRNLPSKGAMGGKNLMNKPNLMPNKTIPGQYV